MLFYENEYWIVDFTIPKPKKNVDNGTKAEWFIVPPIII